MSLDGHRSFFALSDKIAPFILHRLSFFKNLFGGILVTQQRKSVLHKTKTETVYY